MLNMRVLVMFLGIIMITSTISIYSSEAILPENLPDVSQASSHVRVIEGENLIAYARPLSTSLDNPTNHVVPTSAPYDGVAKLILTRTDGTFGCSGTLANDKAHIFTAAHCVSDDNGNYVLISGSAKFEGLSGYTTIAIDADPAKSKKHPDYNGDFIKGNDIAILKLVSTAPDSIPGIDYDTSGSEVGNIVDKTGYGLSGYFSSGTDGSAYPFGTKRDGQNKYDAFADTMYSKLGLTSDVDYIPEAIYQYDSDDGTSSHDAFGFFFGKSDTGLGNNEVLSAPGDSGGPTFYHGKLVGITSYGITLQYTNKQTSDCTKQFGGPKLDSSCGEFAADTRVSQYASFIDSVLTPVTPVPDVAPPVISAINADTSSTTTTITWTTDEPSTSMVDYGSDNTYGSLVSDSTLVTSHSIHLTSLSSSTTYHFKVTSVDSSSNSASSADLTFNTQGVSGNTVSVDSITYSTSGGKTNDKHLTVMIHVSDNNSNNVSGASVSIKLSNGKNSWTASGTTDINGNTGFTLKNAPSGTYTTTITNVVASGLTWNGLTPQNSFTK